MSFIWHKRYSIILHVSIGRKKNDNFYSFSTVQSGDIIGINLRIMHVLVVLVTIPTQSGDFGARKI